jgi:agmatine deiminase
MRPFPIRFNYIPYPLWRRRFPPLLDPLLKPLLRRAYPAHYDEHPPASPAEVAAFLVRWGLAADRAATEHRLRAIAPPVTGSAAANPPVAPAAPIRLPAQWEPVETILLSWPLFYPPLWPLHAAMVAAIAPVAGVTVLLPAAEWAAAVALYLEDCGVTTGVDYLALPFDDIWIRDYGPLVGVNGTGERVAVAARYAPLPNYPQNRDDAMPAHWATRRAIPLRPLDLYTEGGNIWSDGQGTLIMSDAYQRVDRSLTREALETALRAVFRFDKLIIGPHLREEETGHIDLLVKLADRRTVLITEPGDDFNSDRRRAAIDLFRHTTNACGESYTVHTLPVLPHYYNWGLFSIWRSYTNALTVNGRVLVPTYREPTDERALATYQAAMPGYDIIPIDCAVGINGGGAVHCMTKEVPRAGT